MPSLLYAHLIFMYFYTLHPPDRAAQQCTCTHHFLSSHFLQAQLKETSLSADEAARSKEELAARLRDLEKKVRTLEQDLGQAQEVSRTCTQWVVGSNPSHSGS